jgi:hypothetical protein
MVAALHPCSDRDLATGGADQHIASGELSGGPEPLRTRIVERVLRGDAQNRPVGELELEDLAHAAIDQRLDRRRGRSSGRRIDADHPLAAPQGLDRTHPLGCGHPGARGEARGSALDPRTEPQPERGEHAGSVAPAGDDGVRGLALE